ncbi:putative Protein kinase domain-containing protein [Seiridium unicorne]|uniref:Protein kinase domain-containing protein n=1 Tax=Seiridium unicorne TaxID=138068 RepID=A0ABR2UZR1_9PEZI
MLTKTSYYILNQINQRESMANSPEKSSIAKGEPPKILAVKLINDDEFVVRISHDTLGAAYVRMSSYLFGPGWHSASSPEPDLSMIQSKHGKVLTLMASEWDVDAVATKIEVHTEGMPQKLAGVPNLDHIMDLVDMKNIDYQELVKVRSLSKKCGLRSDRIHLVTHAAFTDPVVMKISEIPDRLSADEVDGEAISADDVEMSNEISHHHRLSSFGIVPEILGLVTEKGRGFIGYLMANLKGAVTYEEIRNRGKAVPESDIQDCLDLVRNMHARNVYHGDLHLDKIMRCPDGSNYIIGLGLADELADDLLVEDHPIMSAQDELQALESSLRTIGGPTRHTHDDEQKEGDDSKQKRDDEDGSGRASKRTRHNE